MLRWLIVLMMVTAGLILIRTIVLNLRTAAERRSLVRRLGHDPSAAAVETALAAWRQQFNRKLWLNMVALPVAILLLLIIVGEWG